MDKEERSGAPDRIDFEVLARDSLELPDEVTAVRRTRALRKAFDRALPGLLALALVGTAVMLVRSIPPRPEVAEPPARAIETQSDLPSGEISALPREGERTTPQGRADTSSKPIGNGGGKPRSVSFALGGSGGAPSAPGGPGTTSVQPAVENDPARSPKTKTKKRPPPEPPEATLSFRRMYKSNSGDHFHSVYPSDIAAKAQAGYNVVEQIGYLFEEQEAGTHLLSIDEGTMGWIYSGDQGARTRPLYRLKGPEYHDYEVIFTSSDSVKEEWVGNGWRLDRIEGYIVVP